MASFKRFSNVFLGLALAVVGNACSAQFAADFVAEATGLGTGGNFENGSNGATSGAGGDMGVIVPPDIPKDAAGLSSYTHLCGGGCMSGEEQTACPLPMNPDSPPETSCQIVPTPTGPTAECKIPGTVQAGEPCEQASDCAASLGCVRMMSSNVSVCRPYCCGDLEACAPSTYCSLAPTAEKVLDTPPILIPVCVPATPCTLLDDTTCTDGRTCTLVRTDGTTSCVQPGPGKLGDPCPCSAGHVCSISLGKCLKLCRVDMNDCPMEMLCQGGSEGFPSGVGICVK